MDRDQNQRNNKTRGTRGKREDFDYEEEGVYYTPGDREKRPAARKPTATRKPVTARKVAFNQQKPKQSAFKGQYATFYILTLIAAVIVCLVVFFLMFNKITGGKESPSASAAEQSALPSESPVTAVNETSIIGMIKTIKLDQKTLNLMDVETLETYTFNVDEVTALKDKYGDAMSFAEFKKGDIVDARFVEDGKVLSGLTISSRAWEQKNVTNVKVNVENDMVSLGNDTYKYDKNNTIVTFEDSLFAIGDIESLHSVTMRGMSGNVWFIEINKGVGIIDIINGEDIEDGMIAVDNNLTLLFGENGGPDEVIKVQTGLRRVVVTGSNIEPYIQEVEVEAGQTFILNLADVQITAGVLTLNISTSNANVTIDDKQIRSSEPQILPYGEYEVKVTKDGYEPYVEKITLNQPTQEVDITLVEEIKLQEVTITTVPSGADVYIDNAYIGLSPVTKSVEEGTRTITVKKAGYMDVTVYATTFDLPIQITLRQDPATLPQTALPAAESQEPLIPDASANSATP